MISKEQVRKTIQDLYSWKSRRESIAEQKKGDPTFKALDNTVIVEAIDTIQELERMVNFDAPKGTTKRL